jgi:hypothetical protein
VADTAEVGRKPVEMSRSCVERHNLDDGTVIAAGKTNRKFTAGTAASSFEAVLLLKRQPNSHRSLADAMIFLML